MNKIGGESEGGGGLRFSVIVLSILAVAAAAVLVAGYVRSRAVSNLVSSLPGLQGTLEECGNLAAEYSGLQRRQVAPGEQDKYVRTLMEKIAGELNIRKSLGKITEGKVQETETFLEKKYSAELKNVSMENVVNFLYKIQTSGKRLIPAALIMKRNKKTSMWTAHVTMHAVSILAE